MRREGRRIEGRATPETLENQSGADRERERREERDMQGGEEW